MTESIDTPRVRVCGSGLWMPGYADLAAWREGRRDPEADKPSGVALGRVNKRRAGILGRALSDVCAAALAASGADPETVPTVVGSSIGEAATMIGLLDQMWRAQEPMSPAAFTVSVHNAASGLISIGNKNQGFATSMAADHDTPAGALYEGVGLALTTGAPVLVACGDEGPPASLVKHGPPWGVLAVAVVLTAEAGPGPWIELRDPAIAPMAGEGHRAVLDEAAGLETQALNPQVGLVDLVDAIARERAGPVRLDRGDGRGYWVELGFA